jgi:hypothetical protein
MDTGIKIDRHKRNTTKYQIYRSIDLSMTLQTFVGPWPLFSFLIFYTVGRTPWTGDQPVARLLPAHTGHHKHRINAHTDIHASSGIRTHDPSVRASEDSSRLRPRDHSDRTEFISIIKL